MELIDKFEGETQEKLDEEMDLYVLNALEGKVNVDLDQGEIILPKVFQDYRADFGGDDQILQFVFFHIEEEFDCEDVIDKVSNGSIIIKYE